MAENPGAPGAPGAPGPAPLPILVPKPRPLRILDAETEFIMKAICRLARPLNNKSRSLLQAEFDAILLLFTAAFQAPRHSICTHDRVNTLNGKVESDKRNEFPSVLDVGLKKSKEDAKERKTGAKSKRKVAEEAVATEEKEAAEAREKLCVSVKELLEHELFVPQVLLPNDADACEALYKRGTTLLANLSHNAAK